MIYNVADGNVYKLAKQEKAEMFLNEQAKRVRETIELYPLVNELI